MELQFLGTDADVPAKYRSVTSIALEFLDECNEVRLLGCGKGTQVQILRTTIHPRKIGKIFITRLHGDHIFGLPGFISSRLFQSGDTSLETYGSRGIEEYIKVFLGISQTRLNYPLRFIELNEMDPIFIDQQFSVYAKKLNHGIDSFGYRVVEHDYKGELQVDRLKELDIPAGPLYDKLKQGETIRLEDGRTTNGKDFVGPNRKGRIVTILGGTGKTYNSAVLAENSDILVHEGTFNKDEVRVAHNYSHPTAYQAAGVTKETQARRLLFTHISARYLGRAALELEREAEEVFENTTTTKDFNSIEIPSRKEDEV